MNPNLAKKLKTLRELTEIIKKLKKSGKKIVLCHGVFDLIHPGHIRYFASAKKFGDVLVVTLTADKYVRRGPGRPIFNQDLRTEVLASLEVIDYVFIVHSYTAIEAIKKIRPDFYVKGPDYKKRKPNPRIPRRLGDEEKAVESVGGKLIFTDDIIFSSTRLINNYIDTYPEKTKEYLEKLKGKYPSDYIIEKLTTIRQVKILVIGDAIIDQYHFTNPMGKSTKEPILVHRYVSDESFIGGVLATANHMASLSDTIHLLTQLGKRQSFEGFIRKKLRRQVKPKFFYSRDNGTIVKKRFIDEFTKQKLFQAEYLKDTLIPADEEAEIERHLRKVIKEYDLVVVNDFGHGLLTDKLIYFICKHANYLALNVQANSANYGFNLITKYPRANVVCIDEQEIRLATHDRYAGILSLVEKVYDTMNCQDMIVTRGPHGSLMYSKKEGRIIEAPALTQRAIDRVGAGDALFAISSPCAYIGMERELVAFVGNVAGALQIQTVGNRDQISFIDLTKFIARLLK